MLTSRALRTATLTLAGGATLFTGVAAVQALTVPDSVEIEVGKGVQGIWKNSDGAVYAIMDDGSMELLGYA